MRITQCAVGGNDRAGEAYRVQRVLWDWHQDGIVVVAQQEAHHCMHALAGAICQVQKVRIAGVPIPLLNTLKHHLMHFARIKHTTTTV